MYSDSVKDKYKTGPSEATEETKKVKNTEELEPTYQFQGRSTKSQHWLCIDTYLIEGNFMTREPGFSKVCTLNVFHVKPMSICLNFLFQLALQKK